MTTIVYRFYLRPPRENADLVREQMRAAHRYHNDLIAIERGRRAAERALLTPYADIRELEDEVRRLDDECAELGGAISAARKTERRRAETAEQREALKLARVRLRDARIKLADRRRALQEDPAIIVGQAEIAERRGELARNARAHCGVYWGTYQLVEDAVGKAAASTPIWDGTEPSDPRFKRWTGEGHVSVQLMGGLAVPDLYASDTQIRIEPRSVERARLDWEERERRREERARAKCRPYVPRAFVSSSFSIDTLAFGETRGARKRAGLCTLRIRVGSDDGRAPIWASFPMMQHRPIDPRARIKRVTVSVRRRAATARGGAVEEWSCEITAEMPDGPRLPRASTDARVAIDLGWRVIGDELRVATWVGSDGEGADLRLPRKLGVFGAIEKAREIRSGRDKDLDVMRGALVQWLAAREVPEWLRDRTTTLAQWESQARLAALIEQWRAARFDGDAEMFERLDAWLLHDRHLWRWEKDASMAALRRRKNEYRIFAAGLARRCQTLVLERFDLRKVALKDDAKRENEEARKNRQLACVSELRECLKQAFAARGGSIVEVAAKDTTRTCRACGLVHEFDSASDVMHVCDCGAVWDQDVNACEVMLVAAERSSGAPEARTARKRNKSSEDAPIGETRWQRARRKRAEKEERIETARKALASVAES